MTATEDANTALVIEAFDTLFNRRDYAGAAAFWSPDYIQHSATSHPGAQVCSTIVKSLPAELRYEHQLVVATAAMSLLHGRFSGPCAKPANWIVVDVVRIADGKLAEHWDVIQDEADETQSQSGLPMFGDSSPAAPPPAPPSLLLQAFVGYLRDRPTVVDTAGTRGFNDGRASLEGISSYPSSLGGVPAITLEPLIGTRSAPLSTSTAAATSSGSPPDRYLPLQAPSRSPPMPEFTPVDYRLAPETRVPRSLR